MKVITYNLWNSENDFLKRLDAACEELEIYNADVIALQEVSGKEFNNGQNVVTYIANKIGYKHFVFKPYPGDPDVEGLAILSKYPIVSYRTNYDNSYNLDSIGNCCALHAVVDMINFKITVTNVHLDYEFIINRETQITNILDWMSNDENYAAEILCGDFNCSTNSSIHRYLLEEQTLLGKYTCWHDLAECFSKSTGVHIGPTLNFNTNPRWKDKYTLENSETFDWILVKKPLEKYSYKINNVKLIGTKPTPINNVVPSDHYGVYTDLEIKI